MIYLDSNSTTPIDAKVLYAMMPYLTDQYANPNSPYAFGLAAREAVEQARASIAKHLNAQPEQIYFTSGASESNSTFIRGWYDKQHQNNPNRNLLIFISTIEHLSVLKCAEWVGNKHNGCYAQINTDAQGDLSDFEQVILGARGGCSCACSIHAANNEIGTTYDLNRIGARCKELGVLFHTDATQAIGKVKIDVQAQNIDALSFSGHKINGPKGIGVLYLRDPDLIEPLILGGLQEKIRSGTLNVPGIIGLAKALDLYMLADWSKIKSLRDRLLSLITAGLPDIIVNGGMANRLPNNLNISIPGVKSEVLTKGLIDVCVSSGSACKSGNSQVSDVLLSIGSKYPECAVRFGLGKNTVMDDAEYAAQRVVDVAKAIRTNRK
jgi:cysteine desulfurase